MYRCNLPTPSYTGCFAATDTTVSLCFTETSVCSIVAVLPSIHPWIAEWQPKHWFKATKHGLYSTIPSPQEFAKSMAQVASKCVTTGCPCAQVNWNRL